MRYKVLDTVVLNVDLPDYGLQRGDIGAIVQVYEPETLEVEFVDGAGGTQALVTLKASQVRSVLPTELIAVRPLKRRSA
jgi:hypothetical protein